MRVYLATRFERQGEMREVAKVLESCGFTITSSWIYEHPLESGREAALAVRDMKDLRDCDTVISFTEAPRGNSRGGRHVEFGIGLHGNKRMVVIGPREHIFHYLPEVEWYNSLEEWIDHVCI